MLHRHEWQSSPHKVAIYLLQGPRGSDGVVPTRTWGARATGKTVAIGASQSTRFSIGKIVTVYSLHICGQTAVVVTIN